MKYALPLALLLAACTAADTPSEPTPAPSEAATTDTVSPVTARFAFPRSYEYMPDNAVLVFSTTRDWRHDSGIAGASAFWSRHSDDTGRGLFITEDPRVFDEDLSKFGVIVLNSPTGDILSPGQQAAIETFVEGGGGLIGQHAAGDSSLAKTWSWWEDQLGTEFVSHPADPQFQEADVVTLSDHPVMDGLGERFNMSDEWYTFTQVPEGEVVLLAGLDESTYSPVNKVYGPEDLSMGPNPEDHPVVWARCPGEGRVVYSALGHKADAYDDANHRQLLLNALAWVQADGPGCP